MPATTWTLFAITLGTNAALLAAYLASYVWPSRRIWPPGGRDWRFWAHWTADGLGVLGLLGVAVLNAGSLRLPEPATHVAGGLALAAGLAIAVAAERQIGPGTTAGVDADLATEGLYRYSRHPQYVGLICATVGLVLLANSVLVAALGGLRVVTWAALPLPEEAWLRSVHGRAYEEYAATVPRFIGRRTVQRLCGG